MAICPFVITNSEDLSLPSAKDKIPWKHKNQQSEAGHTTMHRQQLYLLLRAAIAFIWLWTGTVVLFLAPLEESVSLLPPLLNADGVGVRLVQGTALFELFLGLVTLLGWRLRLWAAIQILLVLAFTLIITLFLPEQWLHPFGPVSKNVPLLAATAVLYYWADDRKRR